MAWHGTESHLSFRNIEREANFSELPKTYYYTYFKTTSPPVFKQNPKRKEISSFSCVSIWAEADTQNRPERAEPTNSSCRVQVSFVT